MIKLLRRENKSAKQDNFCGKNLSYDYTLLLGRNYLRIYVFEY